VSSAPTHTTQEDTMATATQTRVARQVRISTQQLASFADYSEQFARQLMAEGVPMDQAIERAANATIEVARACGVKL
jgi:hypothetical protein